MITITYEFLPLSTINDMIIQNNNINELLDDYYGVADQVF